MRRLFRNRHGCSWAASLSVRSNRLGLWHFGQLKDSILLFRECNKAHYMRARLPESVEVVLSHTFQDWHRKFPNDSKYPQYRFQMAHFQEKCRDL